MRYTGGVLAVGAVLLLVIANTCENAALRRHSALGARDSVLAIQSRALDSALAKYRADSAKYARRLAAAGNAGIAARASADSAQRAFQVALAGLPDSTKRAIEKAVAAKDSAHAKELAAVRDSASTLAQQLAESRRLLAKADTSRREWEAQAGRWRKAATRWRLKLGPFTVRPCGGYGATLQGGQPFVGACLTP